MPKVFAITSERLGSLEKRRKQTSDKNKSKVRDQILTDRSVCYQCKKLLKTSIENSVCILL